MRNAVIVIILFLVAVSVPLAEDVPSDMVFVKGGCFQMGDDHGRRNARPAHEVCLDDFYMDAYEVTQKKYQEVMGKGISVFKGDENMPANGISWGEAKDYCGKVGKRLPSEAEWEYAARGGGGEDIWAGTSDRTALLEFAWFRDNAFGHPHPAGEKKPNALGLYDMSGNVWEWVYDLYDKAYYKGSPRDNPLGPPYDPMKQHRVIRGGAFNEQYRGIETRVRHNHKTTGTKFIGFRCARSVSTG